MKLFQCFISHITTSETETNCVSRWKSSKNYYKIIAASRPQGTC